MYEIDIEGSFSAAHCLRGYQGNCSALHGHNWLVQVTVKVDDVDEIGIAVDFRSLKQELREILTGFDHKNLNDLECFQEINPTSELLARYIYRQISAKFADDRVTVAKVRVCESPGAGASYYES